MEASRIYGAFKRNADGSWTCVEPITIEHPQGRVQLVPGTTVQPGRRFMGVALAEWLDRVSSAAPMKNSEVPMMALRRAVQLCEGLDALGDALSLSSDRLQRMICGEEEVPLAVFTQTVGLLLDATAKRAPKRSTPDSTEGGRKGPRH